MQARLSLGLRSLETPPVSTSLEAYDTRYRFNPSVLSLVVERSLCEKGFAADYLNETSQQLERLFD